MPRGHGAGANGSSARRPMHRRRPLDYWVLIVLSAEKVAQHLFVSWAFATDRFDLRDQVAPPWAILLAAGSVVAVLFAVASAGLWRRRRWALDLLIALAAFDIVAEFIGQGPLVIDVVVSFLVAVVILVLALRARRRARRAENTGAGE